MLKIGGNIEKSRIVFLDSARGLAAISVMIWHFLLMFIPRTDDNLLNNPLHLFYYGEADVIFFFIHSGFILSYSYFNKFDKFSPQFFTRFFIERVFRIFPLFLFVLTISFIFFHQSSVNTITQHGKMIWNVDVTGWDYLQQSNLFFQYSSQADKRLLPQDWTLTVELIAGLSVPVLLGVLKRNKIWVFTLLFIVCAKFINTYIFEFGCGILIFYYRNNVVSYIGNLSKKVKLLLYSAAILFYACLFKFGSLFSPENIIFSYSIDRLIVGFGCVLVFFSLISSTTIQRILSGKLLVYTGKICYSLYLWHMLWLIVFSAPVFRFFEKEMQLNYHLSLSGTFVCFLASTFIISFITFQFIEMPFNKLGKRVSSYYSKEAADLSFNVVKNN